MRDLRSMTVVMAMGLVCAGSVPASAAPEFVNGLALDGAMLDRSGGTDVNTGRVGYFSDIYYDPHCEQWWGLSDRGPGGGFLNYETRVQRFKLKIDEKTEGLAIGPRLKGGNFMMLAGTDNDYSVTQNATGSQFDVYFRFSDADPYVGSIQCPLGQTTGCFFTTGGAAATLTAEYSLLPGVLHAYKVPAADLGDYVRPYSRGKDGDEDEDRRDDDRDDDDGWKGDR